MPDIEKVIRDLRYVKSFGRVSNNQQLTEIADSAITLLKEHEAEIRQLRLALDIALDIAKGTCKGIKVEGR